MADHYDLVADAVARNLRFYADAFGESGHAVIGQVIVGSLVAGFAAYLSLRFLTRYFETRTLTPFAIYCVTAGLASLAWFALV